MKKDQLLETIATLAITLEGLIEDLDKIYENVHDELLLQTDTDETYTHLKSSDSI